MGRSMNMTEDEAREAWAKLETAMKHIHEQNASHLSFEELYRTAYTLVLHRHGQLLYSGFENSLRKHLHVVRVKFKDKSGISFVTEVLEQWTSYHKSTQMIRDILMVRTVDNLCVCPPNTMWYLHQMYHEILLFKNLCVAIFFSAMLCDFRVWRQWQWVPSAVWSLGTLYQSGTIPEVCAHNSLLVLCSMVGFTCSKFHMQPLVIDPVYVVPFL